MLEPNTLKLIITSSGNVLLVVLFGFFLSPLIIRLQMYSPKDSQFPSFQSFGTNVRSPSVLGEVLGIIVNIVTHYGYYSLFTHHVLIYIHLILNETLTERNYKNQ